MGKDTKVLLGIILATLVILVGGIFLLGRGQEKVLGEVSGLEVTPSSYDLGEVPINGGIVAKEYEAKNTTEKTIRLKKIATSCECTSAKVRVGEKETRFFGMEHAMDKNPPVNLEVGAGQTAIVTVNFDPAAHGPEGVGPFERVVWLTFSDPVGVAELKFSGTVVK